MNGELEKLKKRARELRDLAIRTTYEADRKALLQVADDYEKFAKRHFERTGTVS